MKIYKRYEIRETEDGFSASFYRDAMTLRADTWEGITALIDGRLDGRYCDELARQKAEKARSAENVSRFVRLADAGSSAYRFDVLITAAAIVYFAHLILG